MRPNERCQRRPNLSSNARQAPLCQKRDLTLESWYFKGVRVSLQGCLPEEGGAGAAGAAAAEEDLAAFGLPVGGATANIYRPC